MDSKKDAVMVVMNVCKMFILIIYTYIYIFKYIIYEHLNVLNSETHPNIHSVWVFIENS